MIGEHWRRHAERLLAAHASPGEDTEPMIRLLGRCAERRLVTGDVLCRQGDPGDEVFFLLEGRVNVLKRDHRSREREIGVWFAPSVVGGLAAVEGTRRTATCVAGAPAVVAVLAGPTARSLLCEVTPEAAQFRWLLLASLTEALSSVRERVRSVLAAGSHPPDLDELHALVERARPSENPPGGRG